MFTQIKSPALGTILDLDGPTIRELPVRVQLVNAVEDQSFQLLQWQHGRRQAIADAIVSCGMALVGAGIVAAWCGMVLGY